MELYASQYATMTRPSPNAPLTPGRLRNRHHKPARDHHCLGPAYRSPRLQRHRLAVPPDSGRCEDLKAQGLEEYIAEATGLKLDAYFSATKLKWIFGPCSRGQNAGRSRRFALWHRRHLADRKLTEAVST